jgi:uncharacterized protein YkwD
VRPPKTILAVLAVAVCSLFLAAPALATVQLNSYARLVSAARGHSPEMGQVKYFSHYSASGESWSRRVIRYGYKRSGYRYWWAGENIYWGAFLSSSPSECVRAWMNSKAHRTVILTRRFRDIGVGAVKTCSGYRGVGGTVWFFTMDVGRRIR